MKNKIELNFKSTLSLNTIVPTTDGYKTIETIEIGDIVFDYNNKPSKVLDISLPKISNDMYLISLINEEDFQIDLKIDGLQFFFVVENLNCKKFTTQTIYNLFKANEIFNKIIYVKGLNCLYRVKNIIKINNEYVKSIIIDSDENIFLITNKQSNFWRECPLDSYNLPAIYSC